MLVNKIPLQDRDTRVTLQNRRCLDRSIHVPYQPEYDVPSYSGLYFESTG